MISRLWLAIRSIAMVLLFPGTVTVLVPCLILTLADQLHSGPWAIYQYCAAGVIFAGATLLVQSVWVFARIGHGTLAPFDETDKLVITGPYRFVRNPMYVGVILILLGEAGFFWSLWLLGYAGMMLVFFDFYIIGYEEVRLRKRFGDDFETYMEEVCRWRLRRPVESE